MIKDQLQLALAAHIKDWQVHNERRIYLTIGADDIREVVRSCYKNFRMRLCTISGVDNETDFELIYHFSCDRTGEIFNIRVYLKDRKSPSVNSVSDIFEAANWIEREIFEMLGIGFKGHPNLTRLLLDEDWPQGNYPLRKKQD